MAPTWKWLRVVAAAVPYCLAAAMAHSVAFLQTMCPSPPSPSYTRAHGESLVVTQSMPLSAINFKIIADHVTVHVTRQHDDNVVVPGDYPYLVTATAGRGLIRPVPAPAAPLPYHGRPGEGGSMLRT
eukprot:SAG11_NODE_443_length_9422_cov_4.441382_6_plen_127_part_00